MRRLFLFSLLLMLSTASGCGDDEHKPSMTRTSTPKGVLVVSNNPIPSDILLLIDKQIDDVNITASRMDGLGTIPFRQYVIEILPRDWRCETPSFVVEESVIPGTNYDGVPGIDKDGVVNGKVVMCVAGRFLEKSGLIQTTAEGIRWAPVVRFEAEHKIAYEFDEALYNSTKYHTEGAGHPIFGEP